MSLHPLHLVSYSEIEKELNKRVSDNLVSIHEGPNGLLGYDYTRECQYEGRWDKYTLSSRGIVLDTNNGRVAAWPFPKFFNWDEYHVTLPGCDFDIDEKADGSLGITFHHDGVWYTKTRGSFNSEQAIWASNWIAKHWNEQAFSEGTTYLFEIVYPENQIVVNYSGWKGLIYLSEYKDGREQYKSSYSIFNNLPGFRCSMPYNISDDLTKIVQKANSLDHNTEGFVLRYRNGYRIKIKGAEYLRLHRIVSDLTPLGVWRILRSGDNIENIRVSLPEEFLTEFNNYVQHFQSQVDKIYKESYDFCRNLLDRSFSRKLFAEQVHLKFPSTVHRAVCFATFDEKNPDLIRQDILKSLRPKGNDNVVS